MFFLMFRPRLFFAALTAVCGDPVAVEPAQHTALIIETVFLRSVLPPQGLAAAHFSLDHFFSAKGQFKTIHLRFHSNGLRTLFKAIISKAEEQFHLSVFRAAG